MIFSRSIILFCFCFFSFVFSANATHLMGGWMGYDYLGLNAATGNYRYRVTVKMYRSCDPASANLDPQISIGAYIQDFLNPNNPVKNLYNSFTLPLVTRDTIALPGSGGCAFVPNVCVEEGMFQAIIELAPSSGGYHLLYERCCRNGAIINLTTPLNEGQTYYAVIPPTFVINSSPSFALPPIPYMCAQDTTSIINTAFDSDGDQLVYSLVHPYTGQIIAPPPTYTFPIPLVAYAGGYNSTQPFGAGGVATINAFTGQADYYSPNQGYFVVAVEVKEYRNNQLIGTIRLDMQIIVITCPPNPPPNLSPTTTQTSWIVNEGDSFCFPVTFNDPNGDSLFLTATGQIFNNPPTNPPATFLPSPNAGNGTLTSQFCWNLACNQTGNYIFIVQVADNGCPVKTTNEVYMIQVNPYTGPTSISGPNPICANSSGTYSVSASGGSSFSWSVTGGTISSGQGTNSINVNWGTGTTGSISLTSYNSNGCDAGPITLNVTLQPAPTINAGPNSSICIGNSVTLTSSGGGTYSWTPSTGLSNTTISNPVANPTSSTNYIVTVTTAIGCSNTDTVSIVVNPIPVVNAGNDITICTGFSTTIGGSPTGPAGSTYNWSPSSGLNNTTSANPTASPTATTTYTVVVSSATACVDTDMVTVNVSSPPVANAGADITVCSGFGSTLNGNGGGTYNWSPSSGLSGTNISNPVATPTSSTTYTLIVSLNNCTDTDFVSVNILPKPAVSAGADVAMCIGNTTTLSATGAGTFLWSPSTGLSCTTCSNPVSTTSSSTGYVVTITDANACTNSDTVQVIINPLPLPNAGPKPGWLCPGFTTTLSASNGITYNWSPSGTLSNPNISNPVASPTVTTTYTVNITDANGCSNSDTITVAMNPAVPTFAGNDFTICIGQSVAIGGSPTSPSPNTTYQWSPSAGLNNSTLANPTANPAATTTYVVSSASDTCNGTDTVVVFVNPLPSINAGANATVCFGIQTTLTASGGILYSWSTTQTTTSISVSPTGTSTYTVVGTDGNGCSNIDSATVFVNQLPVVSAGVDNSICIGNSSTLTASGGILYSWSTTQTSTSISVSPTGTSSYTVVGTDGNGCSNIDSATVFVNQLPVVSAGVDNSICIGNSSTLTASGGVLYSWSTTQTSTSISVSPTATSSYTVIGTDGNGCSNIDSAIVFVNQLPVVSAGTDNSICIGNSSTLTASGGIFYSWSTTQTSTSISVSPTATSSYTVIGTDGNGCSNIDSAIVFVNQLPVVDAGINTSICAGDSTNLIGSGGTIYNWSPSTGLSNPNISNPNTSPPVTITYTLIATDANTCSNSDTVQVVVFALPSVTASNDTSICLGDSAYLNASGGVGYTWAPSSSLSNSTIANPVATPGATTSYTVTVTNSDGCTNSDTIKVTVNPLPNIDAGTSLILCPGDSVQLNAMGGINYTWSPVSGLSNPNISNPNAAPTAITSYTVAGTDANGCVNLDSVSVSIGIIPIANFGYSLSLACEGMSAQFSDSSQNATAWQWNFGDGNFSSLQNPEHTFPYSSNYLITLIAINPPCSDTMQKIISVSDLSDYVSFQNVNVFTPNNDGENDCFQLVPEISAPGLTGKFEGCADLTVYNRWGVPVYHSEYSGSCWDGRTGTGIIAPDGTYYYMFDLKGIQKKGFVTILR